jgi:antitoxin MazE
MEPARVSTVNNWGQSLGVRLPSEFAKAIKLKPNTTVNIALENERIVITKAKNRRTIAEIFEDKPCDFSTQQEIDWGVSVGDEAW